MNDEKLLSLIKSGTSLVAGGLSAVVSNYFGTDSSQSTFIGGSVSAAIPPLFDAGLEISHRLLGKREEARVGAVFILALNKIQQNLEQGKQIRHDDFFDIDITSRSAAGEIVEGILTTAQKDHEEKKLKFYSNLIANICFDDSIDRTKSNWLIKTVERLTYEQLCLIGYIKNNNPKLISALWLRYVERYINLPKLLPYSNFLNELDNLEKERIIYGGLAETDGKKDRNYVVYYLSDIGIELYNLMELYQIDNNDLNSIIRKFQVIDDLTKEPDAKKIIKKILKGEE